jgi:methionine--tRNA ligase beta chain
MFARSLSLVDKWIAEFASKTVVATGNNTGAAAVAPKKEAKNNSNNAGAAATTATTTTTATAPAANNNNNNNNGNDEQASGASSSGSALSKINFLVGRVLEVAPHPESEHLYVEKIDLGEPTGPRTIISGLREHVAVENFLGRNVVVVANLEPRKMRGIVSEGMVLCASNADKAKVMLLDVPDAVKPGERITFPGHDGPAEPVLKKKLAKLYDDVAPTLKTDAAGVATCMGMPFNTSCGPCVCAAIPNGNVS